MSAAEIIPFLSSLVEHHGGWLDLIFLVGLTFGNDTKTKVNTTNVDRHDEASGSAVINHPYTKNSGNTKNSVVKKLGAKATYNEITTTNVQGISEDKISEILAAAQRHDEGAPPIVIPTGGGTASGGGSDPVGAALESRLADNIESGSPTEQKKIAPGIWIAVAIGTLLVIGVLWKILRKKS